MPFLLGRLPAADVVVESEDAAIIRLPKQHLADLFSHEHSIAAKFHYILALRAADKLMRMTKWRGQVRTCARHCTPAEFPTATPPTPLTPPA